MAINVMTWVWNHSRSRHGTRLVLLAIADCASSDGGNAFPSVAELRRKCNLGERAVQAAITDGVALGELAVEYNAGPGGTNRYAVLMAVTPAESAPPQRLRGSRKGSESPQVTPGTPADNAPPQNLRGSDGHSGSPQVKGGTPAESAPPQNLHPAESADGTVVQELKNSPSESSPPFPPAPGPEAPKPKAARAKNERGTRIPDDFAVDDAMVQWVRDNCPLLVDAAVAKRETDKFIDYFRSASGPNAVKRDWRAALRNWYRRAEDDLAKAPRAPGSPRPSTTDRAVADAQALKAKLAGAGGRL